MNIKPKDNYLQLLRTGMPEYIPSIVCDPYFENVNDEMIAPMSAPDGPVKTVFGVEYVGSKEINNGALPRPGFILLDDIRKWRDVIKNPDLSGRDWEGYYKKLSENYDRENKLVMCHGGDYFLTLVSFMGFENTLLAMFEEPDEVYELLDYISGHYLEVMRQQLKFLKPELYAIMDDDSAYRAPFFSVDMYRRLIKPFHKKHVDMALENGICVERHDCGRSESFIDEWMDIGIHAWGPAQVTNDLKAIKKKYGNSLVLNGCWDNQGVLGSPAVDDDMLREALYDYVDTFAPGGGFAFLAAIMGSPDDPEVARKTGIIRDFYYSYARGYYARH